MNHGNCNNTVRTITVAATLHTLQGHNLSNFKQKKPHFKQKSQIFSAEASEACLWVNSGIGNNK